MDKPTREKITSTIGYMTSWGVLCATREEAQKRQAMHDMETVLRDLMMSPHPGVLSCLTAIVENAAEIHAILSDIVTPAPDDKELRTDGTLPPRVRRRLERLVADAKLHAASNTGWVNVNAIQALLLDADGPVASTERLQTPPGGLAFPDVVSPASRRRLLDLVEHALAYPMNNIGRSTVRKDLEEMQALLKEQA